MGTSIHTRSRMVMRGSFPLASPFVPTSGKALSHVLDSLSSFSHLALDLSPSVLPPTYDMILQFHFDDFQSLSTLLFLLYFSYPSQFTLLFGGWSCSCMIKLNNYYTYGT